VRHCLGLGLEVGLLSTPTELNAPGLYEDGGFTDFAAGEHHNLLLTRKSRIFVWGRNEDGQLGIGHEEDVPTPTAITNFPCGQIPARVQCGAHFSAVLTEDGSVYTTGYNDIGQLGNGDSRYNNKITPTKVDIPPVAEFTCGWSFVVALTRSGEIYGWGSNNEQQLQLDTPSVLHVLSPTFSLTHWLHPHSSRTLPGPGPQGDRRALYVGV
jgi:hypothetical protein